ncbi:response regulator [Alsobacter sp. SYSU M60028]|uniref:Response regulator n=1 Tax=Alsobacter ponti TaxID=2962936 RepID=A0ABT1LCC3_9HYPH|nr:response regulator [Alsobacter ponti]MCP8938713.1 response regulator [Alsobacter ponti]
MASILIAEDEEVLRGFVSRGLQLDGHRVDAARDGAEALDMLTEPGASYDLLLTDIRMPMMDGIELALAASRERPDMPILLMTGYADQRERARNLEALIRDVLAKPFTLSELRDAVRATLAPAVMG